MSVLSAVDGRTAAAGFHRNDVVTGGM